MATETRQQKEMSAGGGDKEEKRGKRSILGQKIGPLPRITAM